MNTSVVFDPLVAPFVIAALATLAAAAGLFAARRGRALRLAAITAVALALANPALVREERESLPDVVALVIDDSQSMRAARRDESAEALAQTIRQAAAADPGLEVVEVRAPPGEDATHLFDAIARALGEAPQNRLAGVVAITDGQVHDAPQTLESLHINAPVHALVVGDPATHDRRLVVTRAPPFGIVGERVQFTLRIEDPGAEAGENAVVSLSLEGGEPLIARAPIGEDIDMDLPLDRRGPNVVQIEVEPGPRELTLANNAAAVSVSGVRDRLRVLLITGEPHAGARSWRDLLKSDPSVDLVHFTILRPPEKQDGTPESELSLIRFPTRELFEEKLDEFDLIIFDRYRRRGVLRMLYLDNIARYVEDGGALLIAAGPPFATPFSLHRTPLSAVLPARPTNEIIEQGFRPQVSDGGRAHPVTAEFANSDEDENWGRWFRLIEAAPISGDAVLEGPDGRPLLMLDRREDGRVALLLSDHAWLWARGVDGGGPYGELFRRLAHWLMQEPELEEERLTTVVGDGSIHVERRTMGEAPDAAQLTAPSGAVLEAALFETAPGVFAGDVDITETGLFAVRSGELTTAAAAGPLNPRELADLRPTDAVLAPLAEITDGGVFFVGEGARLDAPSIRRTRAGDIQAGRSWLGLRRNEAYVALSQERSPLAPALAAVAVILMLLAGAWAREGR